MNTVNIQIPKQSSIYDMFPATIEDIVSNKVRFTAENFVDYKKRINLESKLIKHWLRGRMFHDSSKLGTYRKTSII